MASHGFLAYCLVALQSQRPVGPAPAAQVESAKANAMRFVACKIVSIALTCFSRGLASSQREPLSSHPVPASLYADAAEPIEAFACHGVLDMTEEDEQCP